MHDIKVAREVTLKRALKWRYLFITSIMLAITIAGFSRYISHFSFDKIRLLIHVHAAFFWGWFLLLYMQASLVYLGKTKLHKKLGNLGLIYGCIILVLGIVTAFEISHIIVASGSTRYETAIRFFSARLRDMLFFATFLGAAFYYKKRPKLHKRLILLATLVLLNTASSRLLEPVDYPVLYFCLFFSPILIAMVFDWIRNKKIERVYLIGLGLILIGYFRGIFVHRGPFHSLSKSIYDLSQ